MSHEAGWLVYCRLLSKGPQCSEENGDSPFVLRSPKHTQGVESLNSSREDSHEKKMHLVPTLNELWMGIELCIVLRTGFFELFTVPFMLKRSSPSLFHNLSFLKEELAFKKYYIHRSLDLAVFMS